MNVLIHTSRQDGPELSRIVLPTGEPVLFDASDRALVEQFRWFAKVSPCGRVYAYGYRIGQASRAGRQMVLMHRLLLAAPRGLDVDHANGNALDNRRSNLRLATRAQNNANAGVPRDSTSGYKGVSFHKATGKWRATISTDGVRRHLGLFCDAWSAAQAYNAAAVEAWGEFARVNERMAA